MTPAELLSAQNIGPGASNAIAGWLARHALTLRTPP